MPTTDPADEALDEAKDALDRPEQAAEELGEAKEDLDQAERDYEDEDQDAADKARNVTDGGTDAMEDVADALDDLGIGDPGLRDAARGIDDAMEKIAGRMAPERLPPPFARVFFGKKEALDQLEDQALGSAMDLADEAAGALLDEVGMGEMGQNTVSSFLEDRDAHLDGSSWSVVAVRLTEGLSQLFRCELLLAQDEAKDQAAEDAIAARDEGPGGLAGGLMAPYDNAKAAVGSVEDTIGDAAGTVEGLIDDPSRALGLLGGEAASPGGVAPKINIPLDPAEFLDKTVSVSLTRELPEDVERYPYARRWLTGIVSEFTDLGVRHGASVQTSTRAIRVVIVPSLWKLGLRKDCRVFTDLNAIDVVREVLREAGLYGLLPALPGVGAATDAIAGAVSSAVSGISGTAASAAGDLLSGQFVKTRPPPGLTENEWTPKREMCVQYGETDLDFVQRLLEEEGITYTFESERGEERLVLADDPTAFERCGSVDGRASPYSLANDPRGTPIVETVRGLRHGRRARTTKVTLGDFSYSHPATPIRLTAGEPDLGEDHEAYAQPARAVFRPTEADPSVYRRYVGDPKLGDRDLARIRLQELQARAVTGNASSDVIELRAGTTLKLRGVHLPQHDNPDLKSHTLLITRVEHRWGAPFTGPPLGRAQLGSFLGASTYENRFEYHWVHPDDAARTPWRPPRVTERPLIHGVQTALVVDADGHAQVDDQIFYDVPTLGRVKVRFHWDRTGETPLRVELPLVPRGRTCWVRVAQQTAGDDWGCVFLPRAGMEVVVGFLDGDPDRPLVLGCLYNGSNPVPVDDPAVSGLRTRTNPADADEVRETELLFDDTWKKEKVTLTAGRYLLEEVRGDHVTTVAEAQTNAVKGCHGEIVERTQTLTVHGDRVKKVLGEEASRVSGDREERIDGDATTLIFHAHTDHVEGRERVAVGDPAAPPEGQGVVRTLVVHGDRDTRIAIPDHADPRVEAVTDAMVVGGSKKDTIEGDLELIAAGHRVGAPGEGAGEGVGLGTDDAGQGVLSLSAPEKPEPRGVTVRGKGAVSLSSDSGDAEIEGRESVELDGAGHTLRMGGSGPDPSLLLTSDKRIAITCSRTTIELTPDFVDLTVQGNPKTTVVVRRGTISMTGGSMAVVMDDDIEHQGDVVFID